MDKTNSYKEMCNHDIIQEYFWNHHEKLRPIYLYDYDLDSICINIWTPKTLKGRINPSSKYDSITVSVEEKDKNLVVDEKEGRVIFMPDFDQLFKFSAFKKWPIFYATVMDFYSEQMQTEKQLLFNSKEKAALGLIMYSKYHLSWDNIGWKNHVNQHPELNDCFC